MKQQQKASGQKLLELTPHSWALQTCLGVFWSHSQAACLQSSTGAILSQCNWDELVGPVPLYVLTSHPGTGHLQRKPTKNKTTRLFWLRNRIPSVSVWELSAPIPALHYAHSLSLPWHTYCTHKPTQPLLICPHWSPVFVYLTACSTLKC